MFVLLNDTFFRERENLLIFLPDSFFLTLVQFFIILQQPLRVARFFQRFSLNFKAKASNSKVSLSKDQKSFQDDAKNVLCQSSVAKRWSPKPGGSKVNRKSSHFCPSASSLSSAVGLK